MIEVAFAPILLAAIASVIIGSVWYSPRVFGAAWMRLSNLSPEQVERGKRRTWLSALIGLLASVLVAFVMAYFGIAIGVYSWGEAIELGVWTWAGFAAPVLLGSIIWDQRSVRLFLIDAFYWLVSFIAMALVLLYASALLVSNRYIAPQTGASIQGQRTIEQ